MSLIFPLSFAIFVQSLFTPLIFSKHQSDPVGASSGWSKLPIFQVFYLIFLFTFSNLSMTAAVVFTVASLYTCKPVSFSSTIGAIPSVFKRLFITLCLPHVVFGRARLYKRVGVYLPRTSSIRMENLDA